MAGWEGGKRLTATLLDRQISTLHVCLDQKGVLQPLVQCVVARDKNQDQRQDCLQLTEGSGAAGRGKTTFPVIPFPPQGSGGSREMHGAVYGVNSINA